MNDAKRDVLKEIEERAKRREELRANLLNKKILESFVLAFISNVEDVNVMVSDQYSWQSLTTKALDVLREQIRSFDRGASVEAIWTEIDERLPEVNGVLITWSKEYQQSNSCDEQLFLDATSLLFTDNAPQR